MREILFKAKRIDNGEWVEGYYLYDPNFAEHQIAWYKLEEEQFGEVETYNQFKVYPHTVCQYTGLTDMNGVKIFKGDIVRHDSPRRKYVGCVEWSHDFMSWRVNDKWSMYSDEEDEFTVIGNIHDEGW